jgi:hypothetical protein
MNNIKERIRNWSIENLVDNKTVAILLAGSATKKPIDECNDIDIFIIKEEAKKNFYRLEEKFEDVLLDLNYLTIDEITQKMQNKVSNFWDMNWTSVYLELLVNGIIWYERENDFKQFLDLANNWHWDESCYEFINFKDFNEPKEVWFKNAYQEHLELLAILRKRVKNGKPVSYRCKDLPEMRKKAEEKVARKIFETFMIAYSYLSIKEDWEEVVYAKKAMQKKDWSSVVFNIKDAIRWLITPYIREEKIDILNPKIWETLEKKHIPNDILTTIKVIYS